MAVFKELDVEVALQAIKGYEDVLSPEAKGLEAFYRQFSCPRCQGGLQKEFDARHAFANPDTMNARALLRCAGCRYLVDPHNNVIIEYGDASKVPLESIPILNGGKE